MKFAQIYRYLILWVNLNFVKNSYRQQHITCEKRIITVPEDTSTKFKFWSQYQLVEQIQVRPLIDDGDIHCLAWYLSNADANRTGCHAFHVCVQPVVMNDAVLSLWRSICVGGQVQFLHLWSTTRLTACVPVCLRFFRQGQHFTFKRRVQVDNTFGSCLQVLVCAWVHVTPCST